MLHILIADCAPLTWENELRERGARDNAALFEDALRLHEPDARCKVLHLADGESLQQGTSLGDFDGVVLTGSPWHVNDTTLEVRQQVDFARAVFAASVPTWGSCWGLQLAAVALGGVVRVNPRGREIGVAREITVTAAERDHAMLAGRPAVFDALCTHNDEVETLPPGSVVLAGNGVSQVQAATIPVPGGGTFWGVQYHPEIDLTFVSVVIRARAARLVQEGLSRTELDALAMADDYLALSQDHARRDLAWRYGVGNALLDPIRHTSELGNWLRTEVHPRRGA